MADLMKIITNVVDNLPAIAVGVGILFVIAMIFVIIGGGFEQQASLGNLPVPNATVTALTSLNTDLVTTTTVVTDQASTAVNYTPLIVIALIGVGIIAGLVIFFKKKGNTRL